MSLYRRAKALPIKSAWIGTAPEWYRRSTCTYRNPLVANQNPTTSVAPSMLWQSAARLTLLAALGNCGELPYLAHLRWQLTVKEICMYAREQLHQLIPVVKGRIVKLGEHELSRHL